MVFRPRFINNHSYKTNINNNSGVFSLQAIILQFILLVSIVVVSVVVVVDDSYRFFALAHSLDRDADFETDQSEPMMLDGSERSLALATSNGVQCEAISVTYCKHMLYNTTRMPNFFNDLNQVEAQLRSKYYQPLIESSCNPVIGTYLCQLLAPVCLQSDQDTMNKFKIYPCRKFCRKMTDDCGSVIANLNEALYNQLSQAFECDRLPYETNPPESSIKKGDPDAYGPCHDPEMEGQQQQQHPSSPRDTQYKPFDRSSEDPYITDKSKISTFTPVKSPTRTNSLNNKQPSLSAATTTTTTTTPAPAEQPDYNYNSNQQNQPGWQQQISSFGHSVIAKLVKYSNIISIITVLLLLAALNAKRLRRLERLYSSSSASSSSTSSSACSSAPLAAANLGGGCGSLGKGSGSTKTRFTGHDSVSTGAASASAGYHTALARQQQIYSNILLSSPSHQVLLLNDNSSQSGARSKLVPALSQQHQLLTPSKHHQHSRPPQTRAPLPPPPPFAAALNNNNHHSSSCYLSSDQQSSSGYYDMPAPLSPYQSANYDAPRLSSVDSIPRRSSFSRRPPLTNNSSNGSFATPTKPPTAQGRQQHQTNNMLFMGQ